MIVATAKRCGHHAALLATVALLSLSTGSAHAGTYTVYACGGPAGGAQNAFAAAADGNMQAYSICPANPSAVGQGIATKASSNGGATGYLGGAYQIFEAPAGASLVSTTFRVGMVRIDSYWTTGLVAFNNDFNSGLLPYGCYAGGPACFGSPLSFYGPVTVGLGGYTKFRAESRCGNTNGCATNYSGQSPGNRALFSMMDVSVVVQDYTAPGVTPTGGSLYGGGWLRGQVSGTAAETDNVGIRLNRSTVDGQEVTREDFTSGQFPWVQCDFTQRRPCHDIGGAGSNVNTTAFSDGVHTLRQEATDAAGNVGATQRSIYIDNHAPARIDANVSGGQGWHTTNSFDVSWATPPGQAAPITKARYQLCESAGSCSTGTRLGTGIAQIANMTVPKQGDYTLRVWLEDSAGNVDDSNKSDPVHLKFDNVPPGRAQPDSSNGWLNAEEALDLPERIQLTQGGVEPASGIAGYSVTTDGTDPDSIIEAAGKTATFLVNDLPEGVNTVKARAISGAGVPSNEIGSAVVRVDKSAPAINAAGVPNPATWVRDSVTLKLSGADQPGLSGFDPAPDDQPVENGGYLAYRIDEGPTHRVRGNAADVQVAEDGKHTVTYQAFDVAGNPSVEKSAVFQIDKSPPALTFDTQDPADPLQLLVDASDPASGLASGVIQMRASADVGGLWQSLDTKMVGGKLVARMDDDRPDGTQEFRAVAKDVAGNQAVGDRRADGTKMELRLPLRLGTRVGTSASARSVKKCVRGKKKPRSKKRRKKCNLGKDLAKGGLTVEVGETRTVYGLLETVEGRLIDKGVVTVFERVRPGGLRSIDTLRADDSGRFAYKLRGGPSRTMRFVYAGSNLVKPSVSEVEVLTPALSSIRTNKTHVLNGQSVKFSGKLLGNPVPKGGKILELQALVRGRWRTFATPRADSKGEWTYAYKFQATTGTVRYKFRAWVRREDAYPYEDGVSRKVNVTVTGS